MRTRSAWAAVVVAVVVVGTEEPAVNQALTFGTLQSHTTKSSVSPFRNGRRPFVLPWPVISVHARVNLGAPGA